MNQRLREEEKQGKEKHQHRKLNRLSLTITIITHQSSHTLLIAVSPRSRP
jgi:hypothetical protein